MSEQNTQHSEHVKEWLDRAARGQDAGQIRQLLETAVSALWQRANSTISEITLSILFNRVLTNSSDQFAFLASVTVDEKGVHFERVPAVDKDTLLRGSQFLLTETLRIFSNLTDDVLTPGLYRTLSKVTLTPAVKQGKP